MAAACLYMLVYTASMYVSRLFLGKFKACKHEYHRLGLYMMFLLNGMHSLVE